MTTQRHDVCVDQVGVVAFGHADAGVPEDSRERVDIAATLQIASCERVPADVRANEAHLGPPGRSSEDFSQALRVLMPQPPLSRDLLAKDVQDLGSERDIPLFARLADNVNGAAFPVDVTGLDRSGFVQSRAGSEEEMEEAQEPLGKLARTSTASNRRCPSVSRG